MVASVSELIIIIIIYLIYLFTLPYGSRRIKERERDIFSVVYIHSRCSELRLSKQTMSKVQYTIDHHTNSFFFFCTPFFLFFHPNPRLFFILYSFFLLFQSSFCQGMNRCLFKLAKEKKKKRGTKNRKSERQRISASRNG